MKILIHILFVLTLLTVSVLLMLFMASERTNASDRLFEKDFQKIHCPDVTQREVTLANGMRVDCLTETHAIEYDRARKYREAFGQALEYAMLTGKKAGIVLIYRRMSDVRYLRRLQAVIKYTGAEIDIWIVGPELMSKKVLVVE